MSKTPEQAGSIWIDPLDDLRAHGYDVRFSVVPVDLDMPQHKPLDLAHVKMIKDRLHKLATWDMYTTAHGMRALRRMQTLLTPSEWEQYARICITELRMVLRGTDWIVDKSATDWTRHFRCPYVVRDGKPSTPTVRIANKPVDKPYMKPNLARRPRLATTETGSYGRPAHASVISRVIESVRCAPLGSRHTTLYIAAATLGETDMRDQEIMDALLPVALAVAQEGEAAHRKKQRCIEDGIRRGRANRPITGDGPGMSVDDAT